MYLEHFNLTAPPFSPTPDTRFFVESGTQKSLFIEMIEHVNLDNGFIRIIGDAGAGKTVHCRRLLNALRCHRKRYKLLHLPQPKLSEEGLLKAMAHELNVKHSTTGTLKADVVAQLKKQVEKKHRVNVVVIDEAQTMPDDTLEFLTELIDEETDNAKLMRVVLFTMPLNEKLSDLPAMRLLTDRITLECELQHFDEEGTRRYIESRLRKVGYDADPLFTDDALSLLYKASKGVPRLINMLAHKSLLNACNAKLRQVQALQVKLAIAATESLPDELEEVQKSWFGRLRRRAS